MIPVAAVARGRVPAMALARFKDLVVDACDAAVLGPFWAGALGLSWERFEDGDGLLSGPTPRHRIWVNQVPEPKTVKHRVHFDIYTRSVGDLEALGATVLRPLAEGEPWTLMADPEGGEYDAFVRQDVPADRLHGLEVDCVDPDAQAAWWAAVYGAEVVDQDTSFATVQNIPGMPIVTMDFDRVPEPKTVKNRVHWDVVVPDLPALLDAGATLLAKPSGDAYWHVLADPEGNEFCAFSEDDAGD